MVQPLTNIQYNNLFKLFNNGHGSINYRFNYHQCGNSHQQYTKTQSILIYKLYCNAAGLV